MSISIMYKNANSGTLIVLASHFHLYRRLLAYVYFCLLTFLNERLTCVEYLLVLNFHLFIFFRFVQLGVPGDRSLRFVLTVNQHIVSRS